MKCNKRKNIQKDKEHGFSLIELLATIFMISLVFGIGFYYVNNTIHESTKKTNEASITSIKDSANLYVKENPDSVAWVSNDGENYTTCILLEDLVNAGFLKEKNIDNITDGNGIILTKNNNNTIIDEKIDNTGTCRSNKITIPKAKTYCKTNLIYSGNEQVLINNIPNTILVKNNSDKGKDAGSYHVILSLKNSNNTFWKDGTTEDKTITCTIKKATPILILDSFGHEGNVLEKKSISITSDVAGTLSVKSTSTKYVKASLNSKNIDKDYAQTMIVETMASRKIATYVRVTLTPNNTKNYSTATTTYTVGKVSQKGIEVPNSSKCNSSLYYNGTPQNLAKAADEGYVFYNTIGTDIGNYTVLAKLKYGYYWNGVSDREKYSDKTFTCAIQDGRYNINFDGNGSTDGSTATVSCNCGTDCLLTSNGFSRKGYTFAGWATSVNGDAIYNDKAVVRDLANSNQTVTLYAKWNANTYKVYYNENLFIAKNHTENGVTVTYDATNSYLTLNGKWTTKNLSIWNELRRTLKTGDKYEVKLIYVSGSYSSTVTPSFINDFATDGKNLSDRTSVGSYSNTPFPKSETQTRTIEVKSSFSSKVNGFNFWMWQSTANATTFKNYRVRVLITKVNFQSINYASKYSLPTPTKTGYSFDGWYTNYSGGTKVDKNTYFALTTDQTLYAHWKVNSYYFDLNGKLDGTDKGNINGYGTADVYINGTLVKSKATDFYQQYTYGTIYEVKNIKASDGHYYSGNASYSGIVGSNNVTLTFNSYVCHITYNPNGGTFNKNSTNVKKDLKYGERIDNMPNTVGSDGYYNATRTNYSVTASSAWISSYNKNKYNQNKGYSALELCPNLKTQNQSVTLYVNWWRYQYKTCASGARCANAGCASSNEVCETCYYQSCKCNNSAYGLQHACELGGYRWDCNYKSYSCNCYDACTLYNRSASACGCASWNSWSYTACNIQANVCERRQNFVRTQ